MLSGAGRRRAFLGAVDAALPRTRPPVTSNVKAAKRRVSERRRGWKRWELKHAEVAAAVDVNFKQIRPLTDEEKRLVRSGEAACYAVDPDTDSISDRLLLREMRRHGGFHFRSRNGMNVWGYYFKDGRFSPETMGIAHVKYRHDR